MEQRHGESTAMDDCLKLLKGERDEQRLAGLLLVTKFCKGDDFASLRLIYSTVGSLFLERLLRTGVRKGSNSVNCEEECRESYFQLAITVLAALCRVPDIASSKEMVSMIPLVLEALHTSNTTVYEECFEFLYLVTICKNGGAQKFYDFGGVKVVSSTIRSTLDGSRSVEFAIKLMYNILSLRSYDLINGAYRDDLLSMIPLITRQFANFHTSLKFDALRLLSYFFSLSCMESFRDALHVLATRELANDMRLGVIHILQNRVAPEEKYCALVLAEAMASLFGEGWLIDDENESNVSKCLLLVLESSRVEIAVLLNELAYARDESSSKTEKTLQKERNLGTLFSLIEKIIKLASELSANEENLICTNVINGMNETANVVLDYLEDAKEHERLIGDDLVASVRLVGSYLAENAIALQEKVKRLLHYMLSVQGEDELCPFDSICFLLPMLCQVTMETSGCQMFVSTDSFVIVVKCLVKMIDKGPKNEAFMSLACDVVINMLMKKQQVQNLCLVELLQVSARWGEVSDDPCAFVMAATLCALILDGTSEENLLVLANFDRTNLSDVAKVIAKSMAFHNIASSDMLEPHLDLLHIVTNGYAQWSHRFPILRDLVSKGVS